MKLTYKIPPSSTEQIITIEVPDFTPINYGAIAPLITGTTPIVAPVPDPVPIPDTSSVPDGYRITKTNNFSTISDLNPGGHNQQGAGKLNTTIFKNPPSSFESLVSQVSSGLRSEVQYEQADTGAEGGFDVWIQFPDYRPIGWGGHCAQFHPNGSNVSGSATLALYHTDGTFTVMRNLGGSNFFQGGDTNKGTKSISGNTWYHIRFIVKWARDNSGWIKVFIDDMVKPYFEYTGQTQADNALPNLKVGQNNFGSAKGMRIIYDQLTIFTKV